MPLCYIKTKRPYHIHGVAMKFPEWVYCTT